MPALLAACPPNVRLIRQKSAFTNTDVCVWLLGLLGVALRPFLDVFQPILVLDALRAHWHPRVLSACRAWRIWPLCAPASLTWLLQPLDTHVFRKYKSCLRALYQEIRVQQGASDIGIAAFLGCVHRAIRQVLQGNAWAHAFLGVGFGGGQAHLERFVLRSVGLAAPPALPSGRPSNAEISLCFDSRYRVAHDCLWRVLCPPVVAVRLAARRPCAAPASGKMLPHRLRSETRAALSAAGAAASSSAVPLPSLERGSGAVAKATLRI